MDDRNDKRSATGRAISPIKSDNKSMTQALAERLILSEGVELAAKLIDAFPNGGANASDGYIGAIAALLCSYPKQIAMQCCDPVKGVTRDLKFLPTVADIVAWCDPHYEHMLYPNHWETLVEEAKHRAEIEKQYLGDRETKSKLGATRSDLKQIYGIRDVPRGWDAVDVCNAKGRYKDKFHDEVEKALQAQTESELSIFMKVAENAGKAAVASGHITDDELRAKYGPRHDETHV